MKKKIIYSLILFCIVSLLTISEAFAVNKNEIVGDNTIMENVVSHVDNGIDNTKNAVQDAGENVKNAAEGAKNGIKNVTEKVNNSFQDAGEMVENGTNNAMIYAAETTSLNANDQNSFLGISANTWMWIIIIAIAIIIIVLIVKYSDERNQK